MIPAKSESHIMMVAFRNACFLWIGILTPYDSLELDLGVHLILPTKVNNKQTKRETPNITPCLDRRLGQSDIVHYFPVRQTP